MGTLEVDIGYDFSGICLLDGFNPRRICAKSSPNEHFCDYPIDSTAI